MAGVGGWKIEVTGLRQVYDALKEMDKAAMREIEKTIRKAGGEVATNASYIVPGGGALTNWGTWTDSKTGRDLGFDASAVASSIKLRKSNYRKRGVSRGVSWDVVQGNPGGAIWEVVGDYSRVRNRRGEAFVDAINARYPKRQPRSLFPAYYSVMSPELREQIAQRIVKAAREAGLV